MIIRRVTSNTARLVIGSLPFGNHSGGECADERHVGQACERKQSGAQTIVHVVGEIGNVVGKRRDLRFTAGPAFRFKRPPRFNAAE